MSHSIAAPTIPQRGAVHRLLTRLGFLNEDRIVDETLMLALTRGATGGLIKRIDENRELLEVLREKCPTVLYENWWIENWIASNDQFFVALKTILGVPDSSFAGNPNPRAWPLPVEQQPVDELAALREAVEILGFDSRALAAGLRSAQDRPNLLSQLKKVAEAVQGVIGERWGR
ncbi:hypothetical protein [Paraburkholderia youngii]|uniref:hypothetical protein n=1 Tax=Paraburkholderia youngii TaxID=2782701 RepID=UPI003D1FD886